MKSAANILLLVAIALWFVLLQLLGCHGFSTMPQVQVNSASHAKCRASPLFAQGDGYVPDGLTPEEYLEIKKKEAARIKSMNFGAFGPRFLKTRRPQGDWLLMPSLWTGGYDANRSDNLGRRMATDDDDTGTSIVTRFKDFFKQHGPALFLSYLAVDVGITMEASWRLTEMRPRQFIAMFVKVFVWSKRNNMWMAWWKAQTVKCAIAAVLAYPMQKYIDYANDEWRWSRKRTVLITTGAMFGVSLAWSLSLLVLKHFGMIVGA